MKEKIMVVVLALVVAVSMVCVAYHVGFEKGSKRVREELLSREDDGTSTDGVVEAVFDEGTLIFSGDGAIVDSQYWLKLTDVQRRQVKKIVIGEGITYIDSFEFDGDMLLSRAFINLEEVVIDASLSEIGYSAFGDNKSLKKVTFNGSCEKFEDGALRGVSPKDVVGVSLPMSAYIKTYTKTPTPEPRKDDAHIEASGNYGFGF